MHLTSTPMRQRLTVLGSTGSIGKNTLDVAARHPERFEVYALSASTQVELLLAQCAQFKPRYAVMASPAHAVLLRQRLAAELTLAQSQLSLSQAQLLAERERAQLLSERARLIDKSFRAGESALPDMLRALTAAASAESAFARQQINHQTAIARIEQALGLLP